LARASSRQVAMARSGIWPPPLPWARWRTSLDSSTAATSSPSRRMAAAASPSSPPIPRITMTGSSSFRLASAFFDLRPGILQGHGPVEYERARLGIGIDAEVSEPLELVAAAFGGSGEARFDFAAGEHFERFGIQVRDPVLALGHVVGIFFSEER